MNTEKIVTSKQKNKIKYRQLESGTCYHLETPEAVVDYLEEAHINRYRLRLFFGDTKTGRDWGEENDVTGYVGRSTGTIKIPLLIHNNRSMGGGAILDHCIVKIMRGRRTVYEMPGYKPPDFQVVGKMVFWDEQTSAEFKTEEAARRYVAFMKGERHTKGGK
jgi:hypothetical protein